MAGSRLPKLSTIFGRVQGLLRSGAMKEEKKPMWYDVYAAFPPNTTKIVDSEAQVHRIFYPEDRIRYKFYERFGPFATVNLLNTSAEYKSLCQEFVLKHMEIERRNPGKNPQEVFDETVSVMRDKGKLPSGSRSEKLPSGSRSEKLTFARSDGKKNEASSTPEFDVSKMMSQE